MLIFIYESQTAGGWLHWDEPPQESLLREGRAMVTALATDFARLTGVDVVLLRHESVSLPALPDNVRVRQVGSLNTHNEAFAVAAKAAQWSIMIAPEGVDLWLRCLDVKDAAGCLLGLSPDLVMLATSKHAIAEHLIDRGVPAPEGIVLTCEMPRELMAEFAKIGVDDVAREFEAASADEFPFPGVFKPCFGAGSVNVQYVPSRDSLPPVDAPSRLERYYPGLAASVAVLCGPRVNIALQPCTQRLSADGRFTYLGGSTPLAPHLAKRASRLASRAIETLEAPLGYLGVDLVLGDDPTGAEDVVIEINPRLTTSYVGLRAACRDNLAAAMLDVAEGRPCTLSWRDERVEFDPDGTVRIANA
jgi:predicted ATP-grasp superfamily ATP-dependent carboligase